MNLGFYIYDQSINETEARQQADWLCEQIRPFPASYPIFIDSEYSNPNKNGRQYHERTAYKKYRRIL